MPVSDISLREPSRRVGLSKTNVVRYFETREAVFFELLNRNLAQWIEELPAELAPAGVPDTAGGPPSSQAVTDALARTLARRPLLCALPSSLGTELERNIPAEAVRDFKLAHIRLLGDLADLLRHHIPALTAAATRELVSLTVVCTAGLWPFAHPSPAVAEASRISDSPTPGSTSPSGSAAPCTWPSPDCCASGDVPDPRYDVLTRRPAADRGCGRSPDAAPATVCR
ncbi:TetR/AcrR family transcriptional regulator [Streptomyces sp. NPDC017638]|uniref:TetR/AcrR family transcriptional regulator n=1 Tax=Streptomyces sp. NPDC017638 TaxID=3365004 RepID=UPI0037A239B3